MPFWQSWWRTENWKRKAKALYPKIKYIHALNIQLDWGKGYGEIQTYPLVPGGVVVELWFYFLFGGEFLIEHLKSMCLTMLLVFLWLAQSIDTIQFSDRHSEDIGHLSPQQWALFQHVRNVKQGRITLFSTVYRIFWEKLYYL